METLGWKLNGLCLLLAVYSVVGSTGHAAEGLQAGAWAQDITPRNFPISVNGNLTDVQATSAHDAIHARCLVLKQDSSSIALVVCDKCAIARPVIDRAKALAAERTGIPANQILISATHSHSCPTATAVFQSDPDPGYADFLVEQIAEGVRHAAQVAQPARIGCGSVELKSLLFNRRWRVRAGELVENPFGSKSDRVLTNPGYANPKVSESNQLVDPEVCFLSVQTRDGQPLALLANYSLHYIGGVPANTVSADYFGEFATRLARRMNAKDAASKFVAILSNGTSGDVNNVDFRLTTAPQREPFEQIGFAAELLAEAVFHSLPSVEYLTETPLAVRTREIAAGVRKPTSDERQAATSRLNSIQERPLRQIGDVYARETVLLAEYPETVSVPLQAIRIGPWAIAACPCETFTETGLAIKRSSPWKRTFTISLANGYNGYLPTPEDHAQGGYETWRRDQVIWQRMPSQKSAAIQALLEDLRK